MNKELKTDLIATMIQKELMRKPILSFADKKSYSYWQLLFFKIRNQYTKIKDTIIFYRNYEG